MLATRGSLRLSRVPIMMPMRLPGLQTNKSPGDALHPAMPWWEAHDSMRSKAEGTVPVGGCASEGGRCQRISTALHMVSEEMGMGSNSGMSTRPPTTTMQSCRPMAACHSRATGMQPSAISGDHLQCNTDC